MKLFKWEIHREHPIPNFPRMRITKWESGSELKPIKNDAYLIAGIMHRDGGEFNGFHLRFVSPTIKTRKFMDPHTFEIDERPCRSVIGIRLFRRPDWHLCKINTFSPVRF